MLVRLIPGDARLKVLEEIKDANQAVVAGDAALQASKQMVSKEAVFGSRHHIGVLSAAGRGQYDPPSPGLEDIVVGVRKAALEYRRCSILGLANTTRVAAIKHDYNFAGGNGTQRLGELNA